MDMKLLKKHRH